MLHPSQPRFHYRSGIRRQLLGHGIRPNRHSDPALVYELLKSIYTFRIRQLKARRRELEVVLGPQPLEIYRQQLHRLQEEYPLLKVPPHHWVVASGVDPDS